MISHSSPNKSANRLNTALTVFSLLSVGIGMLLLSWRKWPDILIDFGGELYSAWQIANGAVLYKDVISLFGPLSFYVNAFIFKIFGASLLSLALFNISLIAVLTYAIYKFYILTTDRITAAITSAIFLSMFAFSQYLGTGNYNFVCPYSHQMTHGILLSFLAIYVFALYLYRGKNYLLLMAAMLTGLTFLTKSEVFLALSAAGIFGISIMAYINRSSRRILLKQLITVSSGIIVPIIAFVIILSRKISIGSAISAITAAYKQMVGSSIADNVFYRRIIGIDHSLINLQMMIESVCYCLIALAILALIGYSMSLIKGKNLKTIFMLALFGIICTLSIFMAERVDWLNMFRGLPIVMTLFGVSLFADLLKKRGSVHDSAQVLSLLTMTVFALILLAKMALNVHIYHYGFAIALPSALLLGVVFVYYAPLSFGRSDTDRFVLRALGVILVSLTAIFYISMSVKMYSMKTFLVGSGADAMITYDQRLSIKGSCMQAALKEIAILIKKDETFLVLPEGIMLNYLSRRKNPYPHANIMPFEIATIGEDKILSSLADANPDYIILMDRDTSEFGYGYFGKDYGVKIIEWINRNYLPIRKIGNDPFSGKGFGIVITKRVAL